jgi:hypothetical protein
MQFSLSVLISLGQTARCVGPLYNPSLVTGALLHGIKKPGRWFGVLLPKSAQRCRPIAVDGESVRFLAGRKAKRRSGNGGDEGLPGWTKRKGANESKVEGGSIGCRDEPSRY